MLKKILLVIVVAIGGFLAFAATRPDTYHVERAVSVDAPAPVIFSQLDDFKAWAAWSPWEKMDPQMQKTFSGPPKGVGSGYSWRGNDKVGKGQMTITESNPPVEVKCRLEFIEPFASVAETTFSVKPADKGATVTWAMDGHNNFVGKVFGVFMNMDKMIGTDFERGLGSLKEIAEAEAKRQAEVAARAQAEADAKAKADADAAAQVAAAPAKAEPEALKGKKKH